MVAPSLSLTWEVDPAFVYINSEGIDHEDAREIQMSQILPRRLQELHLSHNSSLFSYYLSYRSCPICLAALHLQRHLSNSTPQIHHIRSNE